MSGETARNDGWLEDEEEVVDPGVYEVLVERAGRAPESFLAEACTCTNGGKNSKKYAVGFRTGPPGEGLHYVFATQELADKFGRAIEDSTSARFRKVTLPDAVPSGIS